MGVGETDKLTARYLSTLPSLLEEQKQSLGQTFWVDYQHLVMSRVEQVLWHPVAAPKIAFALHKLPPDMLNETLVQHLHRKVRKDLEKLNKVDIFMYIKFLVSKAV